MNPETPDWTAALELASQHRFVGYAGNSMSDRYNVCSCGLTTESVPTTLIAQWQQHIRTLPRPQPKPEPKYTVRQPTSWVWDVIKPEDKVVACFYADNPNAEAEAHARKLCDELNSEPEPAPKKPRLTLEKNTCTPYAKVNEDGVWMITFRNLADAQAYIEWRNGQEKP